VKGNDKDEGEGSEHVRKDPAYRNAGMSPSKLLERDSPVFLDENLILLF